MNVNYFIGCAVICLTGAAAFFLWLDLLEQFLGN